VLPRRSAPYSFLPLDGNTWWQQCSAMNADRRPLVRNGRQRNDSGRTAQDAKDLFPVDDRPMRLKYPDRLRCISLWMANNRQVQRMDLRQRWTEHTHVSDRNHTPTERTLRQVSEGLHRRTIGAAIHVSQRSWLAVVSAYQTSDHGAFLGPKKNSR
jgi:hypothetical protein